MCYVALIPTEKLHGSYSTDCYDFRPCSLKEIKISFGGQSFPSFNGIRLNYTGTNPDWTEGYQSLFQKEILANCGLYATYDSYVLGHTVYGFLLNNVPSLSHDHRSRVRSAEARLTLIFEPHNNNPNLSCLFFSLTDEIIEITSERAVTKGFVS